MVPASCNSPHVEVPCPDKELETMALNLVTVWPDPQTEQGGLSKRPTRLKSSSVASSWSYSGSQRRQISFVPESDPGKRPSTSSLSSVEGTDGVLVGNGKVPAASLGAALGTSTRGRVGSVCGGGFGDSVGVVPGELKSVPSSLGDGDGSSVYQL